MLCGGTKREDTVNKRKKSLGLDDVDTEWYNLLHILLSPGLTLHAALGTMRKVYIFYLWGNKWQYCTGYAATIKENVNGCQVWCTGPQSYQKVCLVAFKKLFLCNNADFKDAVMEKPQEKKKIREWERHWLIQRHKYCTIVMDTDGDKN